jgi:CheD chemotactic sensory transduction
MVGQMDADFAFRYLEAEGLRVTAQELGDEHGRRIHHFPSSGVVQRLFLKRAEDIAVLNAGASVRSNLQRPRVEGPDQPFQMIPPTMAPIRVPIPRRFRTDQFPDGADSQKLPSLTGCCHLGTRRMLSASRGVIQPS